MPGKQQLNLNNEFANICSMASLFWPCVLKYAILDKLTQGTHSKLLLIVGAQLCTTGMVTW